MKKLFAALLCVLSLFALAGCGQYLESLGECPVKMKTATVPDRSVNTAYTLSVPDGWICASPSGHSVETIPSGHSDPSELDEDISSMLAVRNYNDDASPEEIKQYKNLFNGETEEYKKTVEEHFKKPESLPQISDSKFTRETMDESRK